MPLFGPPDINDIKKLKDKRNVKGLIKAMQHEKVRIEAIEALRKIRAKEAINPIIEMLITENSYSVREAAVEALDRLGWKPTHDKASAIYWDEKREYGKCAACGVHAIEPLMKHIFGPGFHEGRDYYVIIGPKALPPLIAKADSLFQLHSKLLAGRNWFDFYKPGDSKAYEMNQATFGRLKDCILVIGDFGSSEAEEYLLELYKKERELIKEWFSLNSVDTGVNTILNFILMALRHTPHSKKFIKLLAYIIENEPHHFIRSEALGFVGELMDKGVIEVMTKEMKNAITKAPYWEDLYEKGQAKQGLSFDSSSRRMISRLLKKLEKVK